MNRLPTSLLMDNEKTTRGLVYTPELEDALPGLPEAFQRVDQTQTKDTEAYLDGIYSSVFSFPHGLGHITCAALFNHASQNTTRVSATFPPVTDCAPRRPNAARMAEFTQSKSANLIDVIKAAPNSNRQLFKAAHHNELLHELGLGRPVLAFFSDKPLRVHTHGGRKSIAHGDFSPVADILEHGLAELQIRLHGSLSETQINQVDISGISQGASEAIAVASTLASKQDRYEPTTVTVQELVKAEGLKDLTKRYMFGKPVGEKSAIPARGDVFIPESALMHRSDLHGLEPATYGRLFGGIVLKNTNMRGLANFGPTLQHMENLASYGVPLTVLQAANSPVSELATQEIVTGRLGDSVKLIRIDAVEGQYAEHLVNENVNVDSTGMALGIRRA